MNLGLFANRYAPMRSVHPFILTYASMYAHINIDANPSIDAEPQVEKIVLVPLVIIVTYVDQRNQQELIIIIHNASEKLAQPTTLQYFLHQEYQVDSLITKNNIDGIYT